jgi:hypothetical protein
VGGLWVGQVQHLKSALHSFFLSNVSFFSDDFFSNDIRFVGNLSRLDYFEGESIADSEGPKLIVYRITALW